ncbi:MAG: DUF1232 domain-containing protein [Anaerolineales bacterium]|nr:DUF1232 domain-containing protein [Anaerolineales bacterium]
MNPRWANWKKRTHQLRVEVYALYLAYHDPRVPWHARLWAMIVVGYALSPINLIPDLIPILGHPDNFKLIPLGAALALRLIPAPVLAKCRIRSQTAFVKEKPVNRAGCLCHRAHLARAGLTRRPPPLQFPSATFCLTPLLPIPIIPPCSPALLVMNRTLEASLILFIHRCSDST